MAKYSLQEIGIGLTMFVFIILFGSSLIAGHVNKYSIDINPASNVDYTTYVNNLSGYKNEAEDDYSELGVTEGDTEGVLGTFATIQSLLSIRDITSDVQKNTENNLWFFPKEVWQLIGIILGIIFISVIVGILWRNSEGLNG